MPKIKVKFLIDKEQKRVVFAEAGSDFIDVLFSFLTLPLGSIVRLLGKKSNWGSLDGLYKTVEQLDIKYFRTEACKEMLLNPRSSVAELCEDLKIKNIHNPNPRDIYLCYNINCLNHFVCYFSYTKKSRCSRCGKKMVNIWRWPKETSKKGGVFVNEDCDFMISNDLWVMPISSKDGCIYIKKLEIKDSSILEERVMNFGTKEVLNLLRRSFVSKNALTEVCFPDTRLQSNMDCSLPNKDEMIVNEAKQNFTVKLLLNKKNNNVMYAEVGGDFVNQLLGFLTLPLGSVFRFLNDLSFGGCIINLYNSAEKMDLHYFKSEICRNMLLTPKLTAYYGFKNQFLNLDEIRTRKVTVSDCARCYLYNGSNPPKPVQCTHRLRPTDFVEQNPKLTKGVTNIGEAFMASSKKFMVLNNLNISPFSFISFISSKISLPMSDLVSKEVCMDEDKAKSLLVAMLISKTVLNDVFSPKQEHQKKDN